MGQGGFINLVNGTPFTWERIGQHSYQMHSWTFPDSISAGKTAVIYVEWDQGVGKHQRDDGGEAEYALCGTSNTFEVQARAGDGNGFDLQVFLKNIATQSNALGSTIRLGWNHNGYVHFILSGTPGNFVSNNPSVDWMHSNLSTLGNRPVGHICMPGSHDAGMCRITGGTFFGNADNTLTQELSVFEQLIAGSRYFDIRPVISAGVFMTGHYGYVDAIKSWQGTNGESIEDIINEINRFTCDNQELIILNLSHDFNTDVSNDSYRPFTQNEWNLLLSQLLSIQCLFVAPNSKTVNLANLRLNSFIGCGKAAVVVIVEPSTVDLGHFVNMGFYKANQLPTYDAYSNTNNTEAMANDQLTKMREQRRSRDSAFFILSWTLTQDTAQALGVGKVLFPIIAALTPSLLQESILWLASGANPFLYTQVLNFCSKHTYPNVLFIDGMKRNCNIAALAMAVNGFGS